MVNHSGMKITMKPTTIWGIFLFTFSWHLKQANPSYNIMSSPKMSASEISSKSTWYRFPDLCHDHFEAFVP